MPQPAARPSSKCAAAVLMLAAGAACAAARADAVTAHWLNAVSGAWNDGANWSSAPAFPSNSGGSPEFDAIIDAMGGPYTVDLGASVAIRSLTLDSSTATLHQTGGVLTLEDASVVQSGRLIVGGGGLSGAGSLEAAGAMDWLGGAIGLAGSLRVAESGSLALGGGVKTLNEVLVNEGAAVWSSGGIQFSGPNGRISNMGMFSASALPLAMNVATAGNPGVHFENCGSFVKSGAGETRFSPGARFDNCGLVEAIGGSLSLLGGGAHGGSFDVHTGARLELAGDHSLLPTASITGAGTLRVSGGSLQVGGPLSFDGAVLAAGATIDLAGAAWMGSLSITGGGQAILRSAAQAGSLQLTSGSVLGAGDLLVQDLLTWSGGTIGGAGGLHLELGGSATMSGLQRTISRNWTVEGAVSQIAGDTQLQGGAVLESWGLFEISAGSISGLLDSRVVNHGELRTLGVGTVTIATPIENYGEISVEGTLALTGGGQHDGAIQVADGGVLKLRNAHTLSAATSISGDGDVWIDASQMAHAGSLDIGGLLLVLNTANGQFSGPVNAGRFMLRHGTFSTIAFDGETCFTGDSALEDGTLTGGGDVVFKGMLDWWRASMIGAGRTTIAEDGLLRISSGPVRTLARTLEINGSTEWTVGALLLGGGRIENFGAFRTSAASTLDLGGPAGAGGEFLNYGEFLKEGAGILRIGPSGGPVSLENLGMVDVRDGALQLLGAATTTNNGTYAISRGATIEVSGDFDNAANATLAFEVGGSKPSVPAGLLTITGDAELAGSLVVTTPKPEFAAWGDRWTILQFASLTGDFDSFDLPQTSDETLRWWAEAGAASYEVGVSHIADIDHDDLIGFSDLNRIASNFNTFGAWADGDVDGDGFIGFADLNIVLSLYNTAAPPRSVPAPGAAIALTLLAAAARRRDR